MENYNHEKYDKFINGIIESRGQWNIPEGEYWEGHHIVPKCMGGEGNTHQKHPNIIWLYAEEHFIAHELLAEENPNNTKLIYAYIAMGTLLNEHHERYKITSKEYEKIKKDNSLAGKLRWANMDEVDKLRRIEKQKLTIASRDDDFKRQAEEKRKYTRENRTSERQAEISKIRSEANKKSLKKRQEKSKITIANRTPERKAEISRIRSEAIKKSDIEDNGARIQKRKETLSKKTEAEKQATIDKHRKSFLSRTAEEKQASIDKFHATLAAKSQEEKDATSKKLSILAAGKLYYNNGIECHRYYENEQPAGYVRGKLLKKKKK